METVKTVLQLRLKEAWRPWLDLREFIRVLHNDPKAEIQGSQITFDNPKEKQRAILDVRAIKIHREGIGASSEGRAAMLTLLEQLSQATEFPTLQTVRCDTIYIEPYPLPFSELVRSMKGRYLQSSPLTDPATDVGITIDVDEIQVVKKVQVGPMEQAQLRTEFLIWPPAKLPERFVFLSMGYERPKETAFDPKDLQEFLTSAAKWQDEYAKAILSDLSTKWSL